MFNIQKKVTADKVILAVKRRFLFLAQGLIILLLKDVKLLGVKFGQTIYESSKCISYSLSMTAL